MIDWTYVQRLGKSAETLINFVNSHPESRLTPSLSKDTNKLFQAMADELGMVLPWDA